ncbi:mechanosensitive ion channel family protein [Parvicella tangerina]|uniref:Mechanosensing system component YbdG n=1 Tax=Parvicella tangerina TaxID=2829795 RepID=A0A916NTC7_9FLAO|nr:mechanosensitive ion channel domain-containing protein [Parvicella tangerina]CAG5085646.1 Miniconductance mechanosensitive channel YbdG [Parvicella tangerina]
MKHFFRDLFLDMGLGDKWSAYLDVTVFTILLFGLCWAVHWVIRKIIIFVFHKLADRTKTKFDDFLVNHRVPLRLAFIPPLLIAFDAVTFIYQGFPKGEKVVTKVLMLASVYLTLTIIRRTFNTVEDYLKTKPRFKDKPIDSFTQVFMIFAWALGIFSMLAIITEINFWHFFTTLGAASAIVLLVFKDTILGFVASIQVAANDMVRIGDWITFKSYGADGDVMEISLASVKVRNWDNTITTIPTYALISDSFQNWRGMIESGGRRIKRVIWLKQKSVKFLKDEDVERLKEIQLITDYLIKRSADIQTDNEKRGVDKSNLINGRNLTNLGVFRKYALEYLRGNPALNHEMITMVRYLEPTPQGLPLEIYCWSKDKVWENYEYIMSDIFDHLMAATAQFDLELFEFSSDAVRIEK